MEGVVAIYRKYIEYRSSDIQTIFYFLMSGAFRIKYNCDNSSGYEFMIYKSLSYIVLPYKVYS